MREDAESNRQLVDILHEVTGELSRDGDLSHSRAARCARARDLALLGDSRAPRRRGRRRRRGVRDAGGCSDLEIELERYPGDQHGTRHRADPVLVEDVRRASAVRRGMRKEWARERHASDDALRDRRCRSRIDRMAGGRAVSAHAIASEPPLTADDVEFADVVIRAAVAAIQRAQAIETTRADNERLEALAHDRSADAGAQSPRAARIG